MKKFVCIVLIFIFSFAFPTTAYGQRVIKRSNIILGSRKKGSKEK